MLVRLMPEQVSSIWASLKGGIERAMPPTSGSHEAILKNLLQGLLDEKLLLWAEYIDDKFDRIPDAIVITSFVTDPGTLTTSLLIYCFVKFRNVDQKMLNSGMETLKVFARDHGCGLILAYTVQDRVVKLAQSLGCKTNCTLISMEVE